MRGGSNTRPQASFPYPASPGFMPELATVFGAGCFSCAAPYGGQSPTRRFRPRALRILVFSSAPHFFVFGARKRVWLRAKPASQRPGQRLDRCAVVELSPAFHSGSEVAAAVRLRRKVPRTDSPPSLRDARARCSVFCAAIPSRIQCFRGTRGSTTGSGGGLARPYIL